MILEAVVTLGVFGATGFIVKHAATRKSSRTNPVVQSSPPTQAFDAETSATPKMDTTTADGSMRGQQQQWR